jgi:predicted ATP-binding protein involved in virulence
VLKLYDSYNHLKTIVFFKTHISKITVKTAKDNKQSKKRVNFQKKLGCNQCLLHFVNYSQAIELI